MEVLHPVELCSDAADRDRLVDGSTARAIQFPLSVPSLRPRYVVCGGEVPAAAAGIRTIGRVEHLEHFARDVGGGHRLSSERPGDSIRAIAPLRAHSRDVLCGGVLWQQRYQIPFVDGGDSGLETRRGRMAISIRSR